MEGAIRIRIVEVEVFFEFRVCDAKALFDKLLLGQGRIESLFTYPALVQLVPLVVGGFAESAYRAPASSARGLRLGPQFVDKFTVLLRDQSEAKLFRY